MKHTTPRNFGNTIIKDTEDYLLRKDDDDWYKVKGKAQKELEGEG